jgi:hypothetical protein
MPELNGPKYAELGREIAQNWGLDREKDEENLSNSQIMDKILFGADNEKMLVCLLADISSTLRRIEKKMDKPKKKKNPRPAPTP